MSWSSTTQPEYAQIEAIIRSVRMSAPALNVMGSECIKTGKRYVLKTRGEDWGEPFEIGTTWSVYGVKSIQTLERDGYSFKEDVVDIQTADLVLHNGHAFVRLLSEGKRFSGIGRVKAQKLWNHYGEDIFDVIEQHQIEKLQAVLGEQVALNLCKEFQELGYIRALQSLMSRPLSASVCIDLVKAYGDKAIEQVQEDPYRLLCFMNEWSKVDEIARKEFGVRTDDARRFRAAVSEALLGRFNSGSTAAHFGQLKRSVENIIKTPGWADKAIETDGARLFKKTEKLVHPTGPWLMETAIAESIASRITRMTTHWLKGDGCYELAISRYERDHSIELTVEQRDAIMLSAKEPFSLILGGAGCGKTTVLRGVYQALYSADPNLEIHQIALSGRAAQRMADSTGLPAQTITAFLRNSEFRVEDLTESDVVVVDEASMIDVINAYYLMRRIPKNVRVLLVGDPEQLPPVGPGLFLHTLAVHPSIPKTTLKVVKRQAEASGIVGVASDIRAGKIPHFTNHEDIAFEEGEKDLSRSAADRYLQCNNGRDDFHAVVVCPTKKGPGSTSEVNSLIVEHLREHQGGQPSVKTLWSSIEGVEVVEHTINNTPLSLGDLVLITKNDYELEVRNGSLGKVVGLAETEPGSPEDVSCYLKVEGREVEVPVSKLEMLDFGYALTVHKAQGSQFPVVIFPVRQSRILDRSLVYTAVTRAQSKCLLIGDRCAFENACVKSTTAQVRVVGLPEALNQVL